jgi:hypothetical protein
MNDATSLETCADSSRWKTTVISDLDHMHSSLQEVLGRLALPPLPPLQTGNSDAFEPSPHDETFDREDPGPSCDNSPRATLPHVPIESLYQITRLRALRSDDTADETQSPKPRPPNHTVNDFISSGLISLEDAERLVNCNDSLWPYSQTIMLILPNSVSQPYRPLHVQDRRRQISRPGQLTARFSDLNGVYMYRRGSPRSIEQPLVRNLQPRIPATDGSFDV